MTPHLFEKALRAFCRRRPFLPFLIEFTSGNELLVSHPEAIRREADLFVSRLTDGGNQVFASDSVSRLLDVPNEGIT
jgi:hypothetical protein